MLLLFTWSQERASDVHYSSVNVVKVQVQTFKVSHRGINELLA